MKPSHLGGKTMPRFSLRNALCIGLFLGVAGCSTVSTLGTFDQSAPGSGAGAVAAPTYPTSTTLIFEGAYDQGSSPWLINVYQADKIKKNPAPIATITDALDDPYALAMDSSGTLYVANFLNSTVTEYPRGKKAHNATITDGIYNPDGAVIDSNGTLYVSNYSAPSGGNTGYVAEYAPGSQSPSTTITGFNGILTEEALDQSENLYVGWHISGSSGATDVVEVPKGSTKIEHLNLEGLKSAAVDDLAFDESGRLWLTAQQKILIYKLPKRKPVQELHSKLIPDPYWISVGKSGTVFVDSAGNSKVGGSVDAFKPGADTPYARLTNSVYTPYGLLVAKP